MYMRPFIYKLSIRFCVLTQGILKVHELLSEFLYAFQESYNFRKGFTYLLLYC